MVDAGASATTVVPVYCGCTIPHAALKLDVGGDAITLTVMKMLGSVAGPSLGFATANRIKESLAYVALDFEEEMSSASARAAAIIDVCGSADGAGGAGGAGGGGGLDGGLDGGDVGGDGMVGPDASPEKLRRRGRFQLPDGQWMDVGNARFWAPEALFVPALSGVHQGGGVHEMVVKSVAACDPDLHAELLGAVLIAGGTSTLPGFSSRWWSIPSNFHSCVLLF